MRQQRAEFNRKTCVDNFARQWSLDQPTVTGMRRLGLGLVVLLLNVSPLLATTWHVSIEPLAAIAPDQQFRTISEAAKMVAPGDLVRIHTGVYRETVVVEKSGTRDRPIRFEAAPAANVMITGTDPIISWRKEADVDGVYSIEWPHRFLAGSATGAYPDDEFHRLIGRAEQVLLNDTPLAQTLERSGLRPGSFFVDQEGGRLYLSPPIGRKYSDGGFDGLPIEAARRAVLWDCKGQYVTVKGIRFRYAANHAQQGAALFQGRGDVAEDCIFERTNSSGATFLAADQTARRCTFQDNGQIGFSAVRAHNFLFTGCLVRNNNTKGFNRGWEAGGDKIVLSRDVVLEKSRFLENRGSGIWFDIGNENCTVRNCLIADNEDAGIFYEISYGLHAHDNVIIGNGLARTAGAWGAQAGIALSSSPDCVIERNLLVANQEGFNFREQARTTPRIDQSPGVAEVPVWNRDEVIRNNVIGWNRDAQTRGWFDVGDERHWPRRMQEKKSPSAPNELSLEKLHIRFSHNLYAKDDAQMLFVWGPAWIRHEVYSTLRSVRSALKLENGSRLGSFQFRDFAARDLRVSSEDLPSRMKCYPRGQVPGVSLGVTETRRALK